MTRTHVETVARVFEAEARGDYAGVDELYAPDVVMDWSQSPFADFMPTGRRTGLEAIREAFREWYAAWEDARTDVHELFAAGDTVVSVFTYRARGRMSGVEVEWKEMAGLWTFRDGRITTVAWLNSREDALERAV